MTSDPSSDRADRISAEVWPRPGRAHEAAAALAGQGFRVLDVGTTISVDAPAGLWQQLFGESFRTGGVSIPPPLRELVDDVSLVEPPDLHGHS